MSSQVNKNLQVIPVNKWPALRDLYRRDWPKHIFSCYVLSNFIDWSEKDPDLIERDVRLSSVDEHYMEHGTFVLEDGSKECCFAIIDTLKPENSALILHVLKALKNDQFKIYWLLYSEQTRLIIEEMFFKRRNFPEQQHIYYPTKLYRLPKEKCLKLQIKSLPDFEVKPLSLESVQHIDNLWSCQHVGTEYMISRLIKHNLTLGAYEKKTGNLCAWVVLCETNTIATLQVEEAYQRRGLGELIVTQMCLKIANLNMDAITNILDSNLASIKLFRKLGFEVMDGVYWYETVGVINSLPSKNLKHG